MFYTLDIENVFMNLFNHAYGIPNQAKIKITNNITKKTARRYKAEKLYCLCNKYIIIALVKT